MRSKILDKQSKGACKRQSKKKVGNGQMGEKKKDINKMLECFTGKEQKELHIR